jgi:hypothetical protein
MTKFQRWHLRNEMLAANFLANFIGVALTKILLFRTEGSIPQEFMQNPVFNFVDTAFAPVAFSFVGIMTVLYEKPIRSYLKAKFDNQSVSANLEHTARQRLLNEPFVLLPVILFRSSPYILSSSELPLCNQSRP